MAMAEPSPDPERDPRRRLRDVGGTRGGLGEFLIGLALLVAGGYLFSSHVVVTGGLWSSLFGVSSFGLTLIPVFIGVALLFFNGGSLLGWLLAGGGVVAIFVGVLAQLHVWFRPTSLFNTLMMLALMAAGLGLVTRSLRSH